MNRSKARDFYSDYYEGTLAPGLRQTLDQAFASDPDLKADYSEFAQLMGSLEGFKDEPIEPASFLSERIEARLNQIDLERKTNHRPVFVRFWQPILMGAAASAVLLGLLVALKPSGNVDGNVAGIIGSNAPQKAEPPHLLVSDGTLKLSYKPLRPVVVTIKAGAEGTVLETVELNSQTTMVPLGSSIDHAELLTLEFSSNLDPIHVVVPGHTTTPVLEGSGTLTEFAKSLADAYQKPVKLGMGDLDRKIEWKIDQGDPVDSLNDQLKRMQITLSLQNGLIYLGN